MRNWGLLTSSHLSDFPTPYDPPTPMTAVNAAASLISLLCTVRYPHSFQTVQAFWHAGAEASRSFACSYVVIFLLSIRHMGTARRVTSCSFLPGIAPGAKLRNVVGTQRCMCAIEPTIPPPHCSHQQQDPKMWCAIVVTSAADAHET
uniref:Uncharacterized protein n=1 Tax=Physcomitrium patens TaxID=3218 RepID=A0A2K1IB32_PHYPA|nr:hypothetical protein PHYPA_031052 [Physcomitrium patens]